MAITNPPPTILEKIKSLVFLIFFTSLYSFLALLRLAYTWFRKGSTIFDSKPHIKPHTLEGWVHGQVELTEVEIHYVEDGDRDKPLMLFVHGFPEFWYSYRHQLKHFKDDYHVVAIDMRGYGDSTRPKDVSRYGLMTLVKDIAECIDKLGHDKAIVVAHDWGAVVCWNLAIARPDIVDKLVILNVPHPLAFQKQLKSSIKQLFKSWYMFLFQAPHLPELLFHLEDYKALISMFRGKQKGLVHQEKFTDDDVEAWKYTFSKPDAFAGPINYYRALFRRINYPKHEDWTVKPKTLIIWGEQDAALAVEGAIDSVEYCEDATLKRIPDSSHWVQQDAPELVNKYIEEFLNNN